MGLVQWQLCAPLLPAAATLLSSVCQQVTVLLTQQGGGAQEKLAWWRRLEMDHRPRAWEREGLTSTSPKDEAAAALTQAGEEALGSGQF